MMNQTVIQGIQYIEDQLHMLWIPDESSFPIVPADCYSILALGERRAAKVQVSIKIVFGVFPNMTWLQENGILTLFLNMICFTKNCKDISCTKAVTRVFIHRTFAELFIHFVLSKAKAHMKSLISQTYDDELPHVCFSWDNTAD